MTDAGARAWDTGIKVVGVLLAVAAFWDGIRRYNDGRDAEARIAADRAREAQVIALRESRKPFLERQLVLYFEATQAASQLATLPGGVQRARARQRFWELYWGELGLVEDHEVATAMKAFGDALTQVEAGKASRDGLLQLALTLARNCRASLQSGWGHLEPLRSPPGQR